MKIKFTRHLSLHISGSRTQVKCDDVRDVPDTEAAKIVAKGWAVPEDDASKKPTKEKPA